MPVYAYLGVNTSLFFFLIQPSMIYRYMLEIVCPGSESLVTTECVASISSVKNEIYIYLYKGKTLAKKAGMPSALHCFVTYKLGSQELSKDFADLCTFSGLKVSNLWNQTP